MHETDNWDDVPGAIWMGKSMTAYIYYARYLAGPILILCGVLSLLVPCCLVPQLSQLYGRPNWPRISQIMFSGIPGYLAIVFGVVLCVVPIVRRAKLSLPIVLLSWLFGCLLMFLTILSIVMPVLTLQNATR